MGIEGHACQFNYFIQSLSHLIRGFTAFFTLYDMGFLKLVICLFLAMILKAGADSDRSELEARIIGIIADLGELAQRNAELEKKLAQIESERTYEVFDCYRTADWDTSGAITFTGCSVDLTIQDPWTGTFIVPTAGLWRFTFTGLGQAQPADGYGYVIFRVDGTKVANTYFYDGYDNALSINTLQQLQVGQNVTIEFAPSGGAHLFSSADEIYTHWTGTYMQSGSATPPECQYTGQTFEYPGSCRKYWLCLADGTVDVFDCCPDGVYMADAGACLSEDVVIVDAVCHSEDVCA